MRPSSRSVVSTLSKPPDPVVMPSHSIDMVPSELLLLPPEPPVPPDPPDLPSSPFAMIIGLNLLLSSVVCPEQQTWPRLSPLFLEKL
ncbi:unnamed protein product [Arabis nemorensis]|uniref:Uncharacterized protein n=1 Tax=Arabis nemorensis TaxID=586526 RepID=A0A565CCG2_9BRAS|nr:unnamed protein product [Arabis nemorensis]